VQGMLKKHYWYYPAVLFLIPPLFPFRSEKVILPSEKGYGIVAYNDTFENNGNSLSRVVRNTDSAIVFDYTLRGNPETGKNLYAGFAMTLTKKNEFLDISEFDSLSLDILSERSSSFAVYIKTFIEGVTVYDDFRTFNYALCQVPLRLGVKRYSIPLARFKSPDWLRKVQRRRGEARNGAVPPKADFSKVFGMDFQSGPEMQENIPDRFAVTKIAFVKGYGGKAVSAPCLASSSMFILVVFLIQRKREKQKKVV
jgi:hypothetical protein